MCIFSVPSAPAAPVGPIKLVLDEYNFTNPRRGKAVIINQKNFDQRLTGQLNRDGTDVRTLVYEFCLFPIDNIIM